VCTTFLVNMGKAKYAFITAVPLVFVGVVTLSAGVLSIRNIFWPMTTHPGTVFQGYLDSTLMTLFIIGVVLVVVDAARRCYKTLHGAPVPVEAFGPPEIKDGPPTRCC
jgi:carbon starvation protein